MNPIMHANSQKNVHVFIDGAPGSALCVLYICLYRWSPVPLYTAQLRFLLGKTYDGENWLHGQTEDQKAHLPRGHESLGLLSPVKKG